MHYDILGQNINGEILTSSVSVIEMIDRLKQTRHSEASFDYRGTGSMLPWQKSGVS